jgi:hypothetical protein
LEASLAAALVEVAFYRYFGFLVHSVAALVLH